MSRLGLSGYSNPIEAGIDSFAKLSGVFRDQDRAAMEKEEFTQRKQMNQLVIDEREADLPARQAEGKARKMKAEHEVIHPEIASAMVANEQAKQDYETELEGWNQGQQLGPQQTPQPQFKPPEYTAKQIDAIFSLHNDAPLIDDDPQEALRQISALHNLQDTMGKVTPALMQHVQQLPEGQRKVRLNDQNAPGVVNSFNVAFGKMLDGKKAESFLLDLDQGTIIPIVQGDEGALKPLTQEGKDGQEYVKSIPIQLMQNYITKGTAFGNLLLPALAQTEGNDKLLEEVKKAGEARKQAQSRAKALDEFSAWADKHPDATVAEQRMQVQKLGAKHDIDEATLDKIAKGIIQDKIEKPRNLIKIEEGDPNRPGYKRDAIVDPETGDRIFTGQGRQEFKPAAGGGGGGEDKYLRHLEEKEKFDDKKVSRDEIKKASKAVDDAYKAAIHQEQIDRANGRTGSATYRELRGRYNEAHGTYRDLVSGHKDSYGETYTGGGASHASRPAATPKPSAPAQGKQIDKNTAKDFLNKAGGDKDKARKMAKAAGYKF
jgi:hypothetical protein